MNIEKIDETRKNIVTEIKEKIKKNRKYIHPCNNEFQEDIKKYGFDSGHNFMTWMQNNGIMRNPTRVEKEKKAKCRGFDNLEDFEKYEKECEDKGYKNYCQTLEEKYGKEFADWTRNNKDKAANAWLNIGCKTMREYDAKRIKAWKHKNGTSIPMQKNENCTSYVGICIGEKTSEPILIEIFGNIDKIMPYGNPGYEYIVKGGYKIDVKTSNIQDNKVEGSFYESWDYHIKYNQIADYFLLLAFDNLDNKKLIHIWLIENNSIIRGKLMKEFDHLKIMNSPRSIEYFGKYEFIRGTSSNIKS